MVAHGLVGVASVRVEIESTLSRASGVEEIIFEIDPAGGRDGVARLSGDCAGERRTGGDSGGP
jgi:hypothetical protein